VVDTTRLERIWFRRRCGWCGRMLRGWQLNMCRRCRYAARYDLPSPAYLRASQWDAPPDTWRSCGGTTAEPTR
jgi:hypothetical protein